MSSIAIWSLVQYKGILASSKHQALKRQGSSAAAAQASPGTPRVIRNTLSRASLEAGLTSPLTKFHFRRRNAGLHCEPCIEEQSHLERTRHRIHDVSRKRTGHFPASGALRNGSDTACHDEDISSTDVAQAQPQAGTASAAAAIAAGGSQSQAGAESAAAAAAGGSQLRAGAESAAAVTALAAAAAAAGGSQDERLPERIGTLEGMSTARARRGDARGGSIQQRVREELRSDRNGFLTSLLSSALGGAGRPQIVLEDVVHYFAFGSNLNLDVLQRRGGGLQVLEAEPARVAGHRLAFNLACMPLVEPSMASIEPEAGRDIHGLLVSLPRADYEILYATEGGLGGPLGRTYLEYEVTAVTYGGREVKAVAMRTNPESVLAIPRWLEAQAPPSKRYHGLILKGAQSAGLRPSYIQELADVRTSFL